MNKQHVAATEKLQAWIREKEIYLNTRKKIHSVSEARTQLSLLESYKEEKQTVTESSVVNLKALGAKILSQKYETMYSSYVFENPDEIKSREAAIDEKWIQLDELSAEKQRVLDDHLAREEFAEKLRRWNTKSYRSI